MPAAMDGLEFVEFYILFASIHVSSWIINWNQRSQWFWFTDD